MSTLQQNLEKSNAQYAAQFTKGHLALPPAKKYLVCKSRQPAEKKADMQLTNLV